MGEQPDIDRRIGERLRHLRQERGMSLEALAATSGVSRATLSRLENGEVSATAQVLGRLCPVYGITVSRLLHWVEQEEALLLPADRQPVWHDRRNRFTRRTVLPPATGFTGEGLLCEIGPGADIAYERPARPGLEHYFYVLDGALSFSADGVEYPLKSGDSLRVKLHGASRFVTPPDSGVRYMLFIV